MNENQCVCTGCSRNILRAFVLYCMYYSRNVLMRLYCMYCVCSIPECPLSVVYLTVVLCMQYSQMSMGMKIFEKWSMPGHMHVV